MPTAIFKGVLLYWVSFSCHGTFLARIEHYITRKLGGLNHEAVSWYFHAFKDLNDVAYHNETLMQVDLAPVAPHSHSFSVISDLV